MYRDQLHLERDLTGLFSPRFGQKTGLTSSDVRAFVDANPGGEIFTFNAAPQCPYYAYNIWMHGEHTHPGIMRAGQALLDACNIDLKLSEAARHGPDVWCFSNFWIGSQGFWEAYIGGVMHPILTFVTHNPEHPAVQAAMEITYHDRPTPFLPFIIERLFSTFLGHHPQWRSKVRAFRLDPSERVLRTTGFDLDVVASLRDRVDRADASGEFSDELISLMSLLSRLRMHYTLAHYASHPHPNTGRPLDAARIDAGIERLGKLPIMKMR